ncbi:MAG: RNA polymerase sigma-70 factor [Bacteroidales bacterium]|jgi:RNA polymerase sigma-70 factor (ECF subfamily)|nr:RNA polymerase sigma-70 factor [Bacteroidales bacterium]
MMLDNNLRNRIIEGDREAFDVLFRMFYSRLLGFAHSYVRDHFVAENIVQDAFLLLWDRHKTLRMDSNIPAWLLTVVKNNMINYINRQKKQMMVENIYASHAVRELDLRISSLKVCDPENMFSDEVEKIIRETIASLPEQAQKVVTMSRLEDLSNKEIAEELGITIKGVEYHITRSLKILRNKLKDYLLFFFFFF